MTGILNSVYRRVRGTLERVPVFHRTIAYSSEIKNAVLDSSQRDRSRMERIFQREDPYRFSARLEQFRFQRALEMLDTARDGGLFEHALEVGCAEGMFTELLATRCQSLLAADISRIALDRARERCRALLNIEFKDWDVRRDALPRQFDLIVAAGVLEYIHRPAALRDACERLTHALQPGGYLLLGNTVAENGVEQSWLGRKLIRGTQINRYMANDSRYQIVAESLDQCLSPFAHTLLRKRMN